jgi:hypothetical protein
MEERRTVGKMNGTAITNWLQNSFKITCTDHRIIEILGLRPSNKVACLMLDPLHLPDLILRLYIFIP